MLRIYKWLRESNRNQKYSQHEHNCDNSLSSGWYRFGGEAGIKMPTSCVPTHRCGTDVAGWMNGAHPTQLLKARSPGKCVTVGAVVVNGQITSKL